MQATTTKQMIEWDAANGYEFADIFPLIQSASSAPSVLLLKNAHLLTTKVFNELYRLMEGSPSVNLILSSSEPGKVFPPLLQYVAVH